MLARQGTSAHPQRTSLFLLVIAFALAGCTSPPQPEPTPTESALQHDVLGTFDNDYERAAVAVIDDGEVETAFAGADADTMFEIGSITKVLTGELLAIAVERGEVALDDPLGRFLPLGDAPVASVTLRSLATHSSGLPWDPTDAAWTAEVAAADAEHRDIPDITLEELLDLARNEPIAPAPETAYSNFGAALLGHALAAAAGTDYASLLTERVLRPIGMDDATVVETPDQVPEQHAGGFTSAGEPVEPFSFAALSPAGGVQATLGDVVALAQAVLDGPLSDSPALEPIAPGFGGNMQLGYFWWVIDERPRTLTAHDGLTGGFGSTILIDRDAEQASIVLVNASRVVERFALRYLVDADHGD